MAAQAVQLGLKAAVCAPSFSQDCSAIDLQLPFPVHRYDDVRGKRAGVRARRLAIEQCIERWNPRAILAMDWRIAFSALLSRRHPPVDLLNAGTELSEMPYSSLNRFLYRWICNRVRRMLTISHWATEEAYRYISRKRKMELVWVGADEDFYVPGDRESARRALGLAGSGILLTVARLDARKGHKGVIRALAHLVPDYPDIRYVMVGTGAEDHIRMLRETARSLGVEKNVVFAGFTPREKLPMYYQASDVFVLNAVADKQTGKEGFGIVYLDAACCQIPCIATRSGGAAEAVEDGVTGIVCEPDDDLDLARAVKRLLDSPETAARFGAAGRERVLRRFTWRKCAERVLLGKTATVG